MLNLIKDIEEGVSNDALLSQYNITLSRGCVSSNKSHANYHEVLKEADQIMYENKNNS
jgi:PleD family two-component response regulator